MSDLVDMGFLLFSRVGSVVEFAGELPEQLLTAFCLSTSESFWPIGETACYRTQGKIPFLELIKMMRRAVYPDLICDTFKMTVLLYGTFHGNTLGI